MRNKRPFPVLVLEYLSKDFLSGEKIDIMPCFKQHSISLEKAKYILDSLIKNEFIHSINNLDSIKETDVVLTNITKGGDDYLNSYFARRYHKSITKFAIVKDVSMILLSACSLGIATYFGKINSQKDGEIAHKSEEIITMKHAIDSTNAVIYNLKKEK